MRKNITILLIGLVCCLFFAGSAGAVVGGQVLLDGLLIPKFVDPLPVAGEITVVNATNLAIPGLPAPLYNPAAPNPDSNTLVGNGGSPYRLRLREFMAQILPSTGVPAVVPPIPANTPSWVWGYLTDADATAWDADPTPGNARPSFLGPVVLAQRHFPAFPTYSNELPDASIGGHVQINLPIDRTLDWADPEMDTGPDPTGCDPDPITGEYKNMNCGPQAYTGPLPDSVHIHGGEVPPRSDGGPDAWFTQGNAVTGIAYDGNSFEYTNGQEEATIWFHPHGFGITRLNVFAGLAGLYPIIDPPNSPTNLPHFPEYDIPLIIQDRSFDTTGQIYYNLASNPQPNPKIHPFWIPEFIGDAICVNGKTWPYLNVEPRQYRFRLLNGSNARFYDLSMNKGVKFYVIATDDGYIQNAVKTPNVIIAPGERYEVVVDFSGVRPGQSVTMFNAARTPFPGGARPTPGGTDTVMRFNVNQTISGIPDTAIGNGTPIRRTPYLDISQGHVATAVGGAAGALGSDPGTIVRQLTLNEVIGPGGPKELVVNNSKYNLIWNDPDNTRIPPLLGGSPTTIGRETEIPGVGDTEIWEIINITADAHPMHTHLTSFQVIDRTPFRATPWITQYDALCLANGVVPGGGPPNQYDVPNADGAIGGNPPINSFLQLSGRRLPLPYEMGWKDTVITYPGEVTRIVVRWAPQDAAVGSTVPGDIAYPFDPTIDIGGVGYVWHCHILDHEDNEMMRNYMVGTARQSTF